MNSNNLHDEHLHEDHVQPDLSPKANLIIWIAFLVLVVVLYFTIAALNSYFRYEVEEEKYIKVGSVSSLELEQLRSRENQFLNGEVPIVEGKKSISIEQAINQIIETNHQVVRE